MNILYQAHSGLRFLVLLSGLASLIILGAGLATGRPLKATRVVTRLFTGLLDLQVLLGIGLVIGGMLTDRATGHLIMMVAAAVAAHAASMIASRASDERRDLVVRLIGISLALALIAAGIMAIGRSVLGSAPSSIG